MPVFAARMYDNLTSVKGVNWGFAEISDFVTKDMEQGRLLDVGTGPGRLLYEVHKKNPKIELYGLDISAGMLDVARQNLQGIQVDLQVGNITKTDYNNEYFDCIVSSGSFYNWDKPVEALNEIYRILKSGSKAYIFESHKDYDKNLFRSRLKANLKGYNPLRKTLSKFFLKRQLRMTYTIQEMHEIIKQTRFRDNYSITKLDLGNLPVYVRVEMEKK